MFFSSSCKLTTVYFMSPIRGMQNESISRPGNYMKTIHIFACRMRML